MADAETRDNAGILEAQGKGNNSRSYPMIDIISNTRISME